MRRGVRGVDAAFELARREVEGPGVGGAAEAAFCLSFPPLGRRLRPSVSLILSGSGSGCFVSPATTPALSLPILRAAESNISERASDNRGVAGIWPSPVVTGSLLIFLDFRPGVWDTSGSKSLVER